MQNPSTYLFMFMKWGDKIKQALSFSVSCFSLTQGSRLSGCVLMHQFAPCSSSLKTVEMRAPTGWSSFTPAEMSSEQLNKSESILMYYTVHRSRETYSCCIVVFIITYLDLGFPLLTWT